MDRTTLTAVAKRLARPLASRKVRVALVTVLSAYLADRGLQVSEVVLYTIISVGVAVILGIGVEDAGANASNSRLLGMSSATLEELPPGATLGPGVQLPGGVIGEQPPPAVRVPPQKV